MFNSPLQYCAKCKQYVELDQNEEECAALHGCAGVTCALLKAFRPQAPADPAKPAIPSEGPAGSKTEK